MLVSTTVPLEPPRRPAQPLAETGPLPWAFTVVIPFYNESTGASAFLEELAEKLAEGTRAEVILVDDGSTDGTADVLECLAKGRAGWRVERRARNQGQAAALYYGMHAAQAPVIVTMDGDGQNDPADIPLLLRRLQETGAGMVVGVRVERNDSWLRRRMSRLANGFRQRLLRDGVSDTGCALKAFRREVVASFLPMRTLYSFMPALAVAGGHRVVEQAVHHRARRADESKYGLRVMLWRPFVDLLGVWWFTRRRFAVTGPGPGESVAE